jgi:hypothetical protein
VRDLAGSGVRWLLAAGACVCWSLLQSRGDLSGDRPSQARLFRRAVRISRRAGAVRSSCSSEVRSRYKWTLYCLFGNTARKYKMQRVCAATDLGALLVSCYCLSTSTFVCACVRSLLGSKRYGVLVLAPRFCCRQIGAQR